MLAGLRVCRGSAGTGSASLGGAGPRPASKGPGPGPVADAARLQSASSPRVEPEPAAAGDGDGDARDGDGDGEEGSAGSEAQDPARTREALETARRAWAKQADREKAVLRAQFAEQLSVSEQKAHALERDLQHVRASAHSVPYRDMLRSGGKLLPAAFTKEECVRFEKEMKQMEALVEGLNKENERLAGEVCGGWQTRTHVHPTRSQPRHAHYSRTGARAAGAGTFVPCAPV